MIFAIDCQYYDDTAIAAGILFENWHDEEITAKQVNTIENIAPYEPGQFYKRELPCILSVLKSLDTQPDIIIVDGYVTLSSAQKPGLGMHLYEALEQQIPVIGVAKRSFVDTPKEAGILRGKSENPLYISSVGIDLEQAKEHILHMHGKNRHPTLLKYVDQLARGIVT
ncbi:endonuclease V [Pseudoalteromonas sp. SR44-5]|uniref:Endonuclease V n=1 Tax=Pseudoalteromonas rhizosphaerae TaxID=2518973 RepID=A0ABW8L4U8_9GAMM|nr:MULTISPECIES: endonuclease V [unclassified Pseudoalteromonas]MBB1368034.1 endonuclease V [Pseudoalteromonas sp. SR44-5]MBB1419211.1 endonuclease V [Pseudoalteromonas sp. SG44-1]MBB1423569.1 endonuclease V [Pseudoalteromonas sp. SG43-7]MBB1470490.1 endonuclease V [Pseudoalteromonas sp. SG41-5]MBB1480952.1 endonuclease V [Pseudoalteromonas sp. SG41-2]